MNKNLFFYTRVTFNSACWAHKSCLSAARPKPGQIRRVGQRTCNPFSGTRGVIPWETFSCNRNIKEEPRIRTPIYNDKRMPRTRFLKANNNLKFGFLNVCTMSQLSKTKQACQKMCRYHLDILALSKVRWTGSRKKQIDNHSTILYSGTKSRHEQGVALIMTRETSRSLLK